jgi:hypothetical protein
MLLRCLFCTFLLIVAIDIAGCTAQTAPASVARAAAPSTRPPETSGNSDCTEPIYDLAVLRISDPRRDTPKAVLGNSDRVRIGEDVVAIGNPLALEQTLTRGVVSGLNRFGADSPFSLWIPTGLPRWWTPSTSRTPCA